MPNSREFSFQLYDASLGQVSSCSGIPSVIYSMNAAQMAAVRRRHKRKKGPKKPKEMLSRTVLQENSPRPASKSVEPRKLPVVRGNSPVQLSPQHLTSSVDLSLVRLEQLQSMHTSARNEWLAVQERILALGIRTRAALDLSVDEARDLYVDNHYEVLLHKSKPASRTPLRLPPIRRPPD